MGLAALVEREDGGLGVGVGGGADASGSRDTGTPA
jgi:hypothetical protein